MSRKICTIIITIVIIMGILNYSEASSFRLIARADETEVIPGQEVTISLNLSDIDMGEHGINVVEGYLKYEDSFFSAMEMVDKNDWKVTYNNKNGKFLTSKIIEGIKEEPYKKLAWLVIIATIPVGVVGLLFNDAVTAMFTGITIPAFFLLITGVLLYVSQRMNNGGIDQSNIGLKEAIIMGCGQAIAIMPGLSRSGTTIAAGLFSDLDKEFAARFSFLLSIPAILGAALVQIKDIGAVDANIGAYIAGFIVAAISGYFAIKFLLKLIQEKSLDVFAYYCWIVGAIILIGSFALGW